MPQQPFISDLSSDPYLGDTSPNTPIVTFNGWDLLSNTQSLFWEESQGDPIFAGFQMKFKNLVTHYGSYSSFVLKYFVNNTWIDLQGIGVDQTNKTILISQDDQYKMYHPIFIPGNIISGGNYSIFITLRLFGVNSNSEFFLDEKTHSISLNYSEQLELVKLNKTKYNIVYVKSTNQIYGEKTLSILVNQSNVNFGISFQQINEFIKVNPQLSATSFEIIKGAGIQTLANYGTEVSIAGKLVNSSGASFFDFIVNIKILDNEDIITDPSNLDFFLVKSNANIQSKVLNIYNVANQNYTIQCPAWLTVSANNGNSSDLTTVSTLNSSSMIIGNYDDFIVISFGNKTISIPVSLKVIDYVQSDFLPNDYHFCLDKKMIKIYKKDDKGVFIKLTLNAIFKTNTIQRNVIIPLQTVYFNNECSFDIGEVINRYFYKDYINMFDDDVANEYRCKLLYYPAVVSVKIEEMNDTYSILNSFVLPDIKLYAGKKPKQFPFLSNHSTRSRASGSKQIISYISGLVDPTDISSFYNIANIVPAGAVASVLISDNNSLILWPYKQTFQKQNSSIDIYTKSDGLNVINIQWENQNNSFDYFTCTGEYQFSNQQTHTIDNNLLDSNRQKFNSECDIKLNIFTGFILKSEIDCILELVNSLSVIIEIEGKYYKGYCTTSKIIGEDSTRELISYELEFTIN